MTLDAMMRRRAKAARPTPSEYADLQLRYTRQRLTASEAALLDNDQTQTEANRAERAANLRADIAAMRVSIGTNLS